MDLKGLCHICGNPAEISCKMCGRLVCKKHHREGICDVCRKGVQIKNLY